MLKLILLLFLFIIPSAAIFSQQSTDTSMVLLKFNEPMSREGIFNPDNYTIYRDDSTPIAIYKVGIVPGDTAVVLYTEKHVAQSSYKIIVNNLRDKAGNLIRENHKMAFY